MTVKKTREIASAVLKEFAIEKYSIILSIVSDKQMSDLNQRFYGVIGSTDVLSFKYESVPLEGEIFFSLEQIKNSASADDLPPSREFLKLLIHGLLHLLEYHHDTPKEIELNNRLMSELFNKYVSEV